VIAGESSICRVDPNAGLLYRGYDVHELAERSTFEEVAWLLLRGELPSETERAQFGRELAAARELPGSVVAALRLLPPSAHPMDVLRTGVSMLGTFDAERGHGREVNLRRATQLIAKTATLITTGWRIARGQRPIAPRDGGSHAHHFLFTLTGQEPEPWKTRMLEQILILYAEHEFNASTFSARVTASTLSDMYAAVTAALGTLKGPLHGGANEAALEVLREIGSPDRVESWVKERLARREKIMGFGHRVYKRGDSRVPMMRAFCRQLGERFAQPHWAAIGERLEQVMQREKNLCANVDLYAAPVLHLMGLPAELNTPVFAAARVAGWCAHVIEQHDHNRLIRPRSLYVGAGRRAYPAQRGAAVG
jgi:2-methylcitrate synthase/citrate synthase II